jgi:hypothetical protein
MISVFLFLAGLVISLFIIHYAVSCVILSTAFVCSLVHAAITVMPVIFHDSPYMSPFSAPASYISRKLTLAVFNTVNNVMDFLWIFRCSVRRRDDDASLHPAVTRVTTHADLSYRKLLSLDLTKAAHIAAARANGQLDARASDCTLDQLDEEG